MEIRKMSSLSWRERFQKTLDELHQAGDRPRIAIVGIGHELRGDDAAGVLLARQLEESLGDCDDFLVISAGSVPENFVGVLRRFAPNLVLMVDSARMGEEPGGVYWLNWQDTLGISASTHSLPLHVLASYLASEIGCRVCLLGIQPANISFATSLTPVVQKAVNATALVLSEALKG
jgi:hydrogenase 3 maturation protease